MSDRDAVAASLRAVFAGLSAQGERHLGEVQADLRQTRYLLAAAIEKLGASFIGIHDAMLAQHALITTHAADAGAAASIALQQNLAQLQAQSRRHADAAMTALQFEDMTAQLIGRIVGHVESLQTVLGAVGESAKDLARDAATSPAGAANAPTGAPAGEPGAAALAVLASLDRMLDEQAAAVPSAARKAVAQTHMDSGDIELF